MTLLSQRVAVLTVLVVLTFVSGCQKTYYAFWEQLGKEKRHLLRDQVEQTRTEQEKASKQFEDVLTGIKTMYGFEGGDLEKFYRKLNSEYEGCEERAEVVRDRIARVEQTAADLFKEWGTEIDEITSAKLRSKSKRSLDVTRQRYDRLHLAMAKAESKMEPVLKDLRNYVLYLKHNLNAQAIGALRQEVADIESEVEMLIADMSTSIKEAEDFLKSFE